MRFLLLLFLVIGLSTAALQAQPAPPDTTKGRYHRPLFSQVKVRRNVAFAQVSGLLGQTQPLYLDFYEPSGDTVRRRPLVLLAHEGAFVTGTRDDVVMTELCTRLARLGYTAASIDYRLLFFPFDSVGIGRAAIRATQDMRAAVRFFRHDAATARRFKVDGRYIFVGGSSAGAFMALQTAYLDKAAEVPAYLNLGALGGLEGSGGNAGYSSQPRAVINLCGALAQAGWLQAGDVPLLSIHGTRDGIVPYQRGLIGGPLPAQVVAGSAVLRRRAQAVGVPNVLRPLRGAGHVPYSFEPTYVDSVFVPIREFLRPLLGSGAPGPLLAAALNPRRAAVATAALPPRRVRLVPSSADLVGAAPPENLPLPAAAAEGEAIGPPD
ncbi:alpha/beta hydrolase [Hymenobacter lapidiphilus]|uniref:Alpha/beta hydrolase fold domain-containing protein n=1 Tax=Hymenobacter lapidiphilus TaxID=2608003 RepID=A0A7Y7PLV2_9BACT|nr:alpha/beta hydrolase [Hymenobacter lapidiphilus]NVO30188.1 alpha/beta hydrolase fold domain-containing protein [Hymenobacter lapidiphilus]